MIRKVVTAKLALSAVLAMSAWAQAQSSTGQQSGLTNPGFEEPQVKEGSYVLVETMPGWKTTDTHFEIWGRGFSEFQRTRVLSSWNSTRTSMGLSIRTPQGFSQAPCLSLRSLIAVAAARTP